MELPTSLFQNHEDSDESDVAIVSAPIPPWLRGSYIRLGPAKFDFSDDFTVTNFLDGLGMLSKFEIKDGKVTLCKRFLQSEAYKRSLQEKRPVYGEFRTGGMKDDFGFFNKVLNMLGTKGISDNNNVNVYGVGSELLAISEGFLIHAFDKESLETKQKYDLHKLLGLHMASAHPLIDTHGTMYTAGISFSATGCKYKIIKIPNYKGNKNMPADQAFKNAEILCTFSPSWTTCFSYCFHSFAMTENFIIFIEQPLLFSLMKLPEVRLNAKPFEHAMQWCPQEKNRFHLISKKTGELYKTKIYSESPFFFFHIANAYEEAGGGSIVLDIGTYPDTSVYDTMNIKTLRTQMSQNYCQVTRFVVPGVRDARHFPEGDQVPFGKREGDKLILSGMPLGPPGMEGICVNPIMRFKRHRYVYGSGTFCSGFYHNALGKIDVDTGSTVLWRDRNHPNSCFPGEPIFVPRHDGKDGNVEEDEGIIISAVSVPPSNNSGGLKDFLLFLDPKTMKEICRAEFPNIRIPQCVHGQWIPD